ncbi:hypothetical protein QYF36_006701 [Acer negundo]|nr:hypothetical protein QYF36_006701 [Acer negundo]
MSFKARARARERVKTAEIDVLPPEIEIEIGEINKEEEIRAKEEEESLGVVKRLLEFVFEWWLNRLGFGEHEDDGGGGVVAVWIWWIGGGGGAGLVEVAVVWRWWQCWLEVVVVVDWSWWRCGSGGGAVWKKKEEMNNGSYFAKS